VGFPYQWVLDREEKTGDLVGFMHTHPGFQASPSLRDDATMEQWVLSFGKPLLCLIEGINGLKGYLYYSDECNPVPVRTIKRFGDLIVGIMPKFGAQFPTPIVPNDQIHKQAKQIVSQAVLEAHCTAQALNQGIENRVNAQLAKGVVRWNNEDNGWLGANEAAILGNKNEPCAKCGTTTKERKWFHGGDGSGFGHILVCFYCSKQLDVSWYGCGCGG
jgi:hypothetical protein